MIWHAANLVRAMHVSPESSRATEPRSARAPSWRRQLAIDVLAMAGAASVPVLALSSDTRRPIDWSVATGELVAFVAAHVLIGAALGLYIGKWRYGSFEEVGRLFGAVAGATSFLAVLNTVLHFPVIEGSVFGAGVLSLLAMLATRYVARTIHERRLRPSRSTTRRVIVLGAGDGGAQIVRAMMRNPDSPFLPVALLDDDPRRARLRLSGVPVMGTRHDLRRVAESSGARTLVIAIPSAGAALIREMLDLAATSGMEVRVSPPVAELLGGVLRVSDIRSITDADLLGRREIRIDVSSVAGYLTDRRVLVTGAGGSIGSELCRQVSRFGPRELIMLDRDESALHSLELSLQGRALLNDNNVVVADIRDRDRMFDILTERAPDVVFHAAALKHLPLLELYPSEAFKTNVLGTENVLDAALAARVSRFVNISTDKAADPCSVLGFSKRITERLTAYAAEQSGGPYLSVRFGNVLGSRGSVLPAFRAQIEAGGPVTVTHPDVTRYFMTVEEAVRLVIQSAAIGLGGQVLVLDMGDPVKIAQVAQRLIETSDRSVEIVYTGLRPGEKLHESLLGADEPDQRPAHEMISQVNVPPLHASALRLLDTSGAEHHLADMLRWLAAAPALPPAIPRPRRDPAPQGRFAAGSGRRPALANVARTGSASR